VKCISLLQPYAWCVGAGLKPAETRTWKHSHRGPLLIAASKRIDHAAYDYLRALGVVLPKKEDLVLGHIIAKTNMTDCVRFTRDHEKYALCPLYDGYVFWLTDTKMLEVPVPVKGTLGIYDVAWP
jgi:hypothetical protein